MTLEEERERINALKKKMREDAERDRKNMKAMDRKALLEDACVIGGLLLILGVILLLIL